MSRVDALAAAAETEPVKFLEITRAYSKQPTIIVCIFEGNDAKYYNSRLATTFGDNGWQGIHSGGRSSVIDLHELLSNHATYQKYRFISFVDNDYDEPFVNPDPDRIYVTPGYSVENLYSSATCLNSILAAEFNVTPINERHLEHKACLDAFKKVFDETCEHLLTFNGWAKSRIIQKAKGAPPIKLFLNDATIDMLVEVDLKSSKIIYNPNDIKSVFKKADPSLLCPQSVSEAIKSFPPPVRYHKFRGKQQLAAFGQFLTHLQKDFKSGGKIIFNKKTKMKAEFIHEGSDLMSELSQYAETPDCLRAFLRRH